MTEERAGRLTLPIETGTDEEGQALVGPLTAEDFVDAGWYNSPFRPLSPRFRDWIDFTSRRVADKAKTFVDMTHEAGREAMMFLGDNWIGMEPYGKHFPGIGMDAVVGSVGSAATCRVIADIPDVRYTEGRFLPYFFPGVFREGGDAGAEDEARIDVAVSLGAGESVWLDLRCGEGVTRTPNRMQNDDNGEP